MHLRNDDNLSSNPVVRLSYSHGCEGMVSVHCFQSTQDTTEVVRGYFPVAAKGVLVRRYMLESIRTRVDESHNQMELRPMGGQ